VEMLEKVQQTPKTIKKEKESQSDQKINFFKFISQKNCNV
jgi:hypothetical protein